MLNFCNVYFIFANAFSIKKLQSMKIKLLNKWANLVRETLT